MAAEVAWPGVTRVQPVQDGTGGNYANANGPALPGADIATSHIDRGGSGTTASTSYARHFNGCNFLFVDGHVKWMMRKDGIGSEQDAGFQNWWHPWQM